MENAFLAYMYRLRYIERWSLMRNVVRENVAEHSFHVALLAHTLGSIAREAFHRDIPMDMVVSAALFHDATEVLTGDIPTPVKHHNDAILANFRELERLAGERLVGMVPKALAGVYEPLVRQEGDDLSDEVMQIVKAADLLDAFLKCSSELQAGNREFAVAREQTLTAVRQLKMPEVDYFLMHYAPAFEQSLDELERL